MAKVEKIEIIAGGDEPLIDLTLDGDPRYYVSATGKESVLTHNTSWPDIDCLHSDTRVLLADMTSKIISHLQPGDMVMDANFTPQKVLFVKQRKFNPAKDVIYCIYCLNIDTNTYGYIIANHEHRLLLANCAVDQHQAVPVGLLHEGDHLSGACIVSIAPIQVDDMNLTDITVENASTFRCIPFDVIEEINEVGTHILTGIPGYISIVPDEEREEYVQSCKLKTGSRSIKLGGLG